MIGPASINDFLRLAQLSFSKRAYISWVDVHGRDQIEYYATREIAEKVAEWRREGPPYGGHYALHKT